MGVRVKFFKTNRANVDDLEAQVNAFAADTEAAGGTVTGAQFNTVLENLDLVLFAMVTYEMGDDAARLGSVAAAIDNLAVMDEPVIELLEANGT